MTASLFRAVGLDSMTTREQLASRVAKRVVAAVAVAVAVVAVVSSVTRGSADNKGMTIVAGEGEQSTLRTTMHG